MCKINGNKDDLIIVKAKLKILTKEEGGKRTTGIKSGYRPNHFLEDKRAYMGEIIFKNVEYIYPADEMIVTIKYFPGQKIRDLIILDKKYKICEGSYLIAEAEILKII